MSDLWARVALIGGALLVAAVIGLVLRWRAGGPSRSIVVPDLEPGVYFFASASCSSCSSARRKLADALGPGGFTEFVWEEEPGVFDRVGVEAVPATLVVEALGRGRLFPGQPEPALSDL